MFHGCGGEPELTKTRCLLDTRNANVNNMLDEKSTRITKFEECGFSVIYKKKLIQSKDKEHVQLRFGVQKSPVIFKEQWSQLEQTWQFDRVTDIITYGLLYFLRN